MRLRSALTPVLSVAAALALTGTAMSVTAGTASAGTMSRLATCQEKALGVHAAPGGQRNVARVDVTNHGNRACVVDRIPTITFRGLDGSAQTVPPAESGPYTATAGPPGDARRGPPAPPSPPGRLEERGC
ncbi:DUF4232 domain-containing protein, partial [Streptomyces sp. NPDC059604]|uniref:DUF4232 domain-containing protein n=1 Tax=Streptomyces sp. NPDC059604 TaxID=3346881 RepID=UPI00368A3AB7